MLRKKQINKIWEDIEKKEIAMDMHILKPGSHNKYFYLKTQKKVTQYTQYKKFNKNTWFVELKKTIALVK